MEQKFLDIDREMGAAMASPPRRYPATAQTTSDHGPTTTFEAFDDDGDEWMQEMPLPPPRPVRLPLRPVFPVQGKATTPRTGRLAYTIGWDGTKNLTHAQAAPLKKEQRKIQKELTTSAASEASRRMWLVTPVLTKMRRPTPRQTSTS